MGVGGWGQGRAWEKLQRRAGQRVRVKGGGRTCSHLLLGGTERQERQGLPHHPDVGLRGLGPHARPLQLFCVGRVKGGCTLCGDCVSGEPCVFLMGEGEEGEEGGNVGRGLDKCGDEAVNKELSRHRKPCGGGA